MSTRENVVQIEPKSLVSNTPSFKLKSEPKQSHIIIRYKVLDKRTIKTAFIRSVKLSSSSWIKLRYFQVVELFYERLKHLLVIDHSCSSIEIYHKTGSPIVTNPSDYFKHIHQFNEKDFNFVLILPRQLERFEDMINSVNFNTNGPHGHDCSLCPIPITHLRTQSTYLFKMSMSKINVERLKFSCSIYFHIPVSCISISLEDAAHNFKHKLEDSFVIDTDKVLNQYYNLYLVVSDQYWEPYFLNAFKYDSYFPICEHSNDVLVYLNAYLLNLVRKVNLEYSADLINGCLGLLERISCFPPLIHSLQLLFSGSIITLPHKIALVEGLITTISLLDFKFVHMEQCDLPCLWYYLEINSKKSYPGYQLFQLPLSERSSSTIPSFKTIEPHFRECPQQVYDYFLFRKELCKISKYRLCPFEHPILIYQKLIINPLCNNGLTRIPSNKKFIPCVFYGHSPNTSLKMIDCYSPYHGRLISFNPFEIETPERYVPSDINKYSKLLIILDISNDMNNTLDGHNYFSSHISPDNVFSQLDTALILIDIIIDFLVSSQLNYLLGITLVSNDHSFHNGFFVLQDLTLEHCYSVKDLRNWIINAQLSELLLRPPSGGIVSALDYYIKKKYTNNTLLFLFTNQSYEKQYYGPNVHDINTNIQKLSYQVNVVLFGNTLGTRIEPLCNKSHGKLINSKLFVSLSSRDSNDPMFYCSQFREYINFMRDLLTRNNTSNKFSSFEEVCRMYKSHLSRSENSLESSTNKMSRLIV